MVAPAVKEQIDQMIQPDFAVSLFTIVEGKMCQKAGSVFDIGAVCEHPPEQCLVVLEVM
ncbi:hypothetical protein D3C76_1019480 [compost metagenome]